MPCDPVGKGKGGEQRSDPGAGEPQVGSYAGTGDGERGAVEIVDDAGKKQERDGKNTHPADTGMAWDVQHSEAVICTYPPSPAMIADGEPDDLFRYHRRFDDYAFTLYSRGAQRPVVLRLEAVGSS